ncbi:GNAT family N-acetyltransferase [Nocardia pseudovaccinii]|uniref:GNAT family N-acetyltransferase n=1 Tax=Nocardia pseudovaccinii TaxID=189540 RepID=UPI0007A3C06D|nr:GNAT family N-acetyltransferase [Nocardia pseudovaccinii]
MTDGQWVRRAELSEVAAVATAFAEASRDEAVSAWVMDGHPEIMTAFENDYAPILIEETIGRDEVWIAGIGSDIRAVSLWQQVDSIERYQEEAAQARTRAEGSDLRPLHRMAAVTALLAEHHPREFPHRYLYAIATVPQWRGHGAGAAIIGNRLKEAAAQGLPVYLEASTVRSSQLYERLGFARTGAPLPLPDGGPTLWPMWFRG